MINPVNEEIIIQKEAACSKFIFLNNWFSEAYPVRKKNQIKYGRFYFLVLGLSSPQGSALNLCVKAGFYILQIVFNKTYTIMLIFYSLFIIPTAELDTCAKVQRTL